MTDLPPIDLLVTATDNPDQIAPPAAKEVCPVRAMMLLQERGEIAYSPNVYELMGAAKETDAKSCLQPVRKHVSISRLQIKTTTSFSYPPAPIIEHATRLNVDSVFMSSLGRSSIHQRFTAMSLKKCCAANPLATLLIREQMQNHEDDRVRMKGV